MSVPEKTQAEDDALTQLGDYAMGVARDYGNGLYPREIGARLLSKAVEVGVARPIGATMKDADPWPVAPAPVAGDAEFETQLGKLVDAATDWGYAGGTGHKFPSGKDEILAGIEDRRARVLALYEQAGDAKLRELRAELDEYGYNSDNRNDWDDGFVAFKELALDKIDAMLKDATDEDSR
jgi:hypothetical protein